MLEILGQTPTVIWLAAGLALYMAWAIGANDVANAMGTSVGSGALTVPLAILVAGVLEFGGAFLAGGHVTETIRQGILDPEAFADSPDLFVYAMLAALAAAGTWLIIASRAGWPVSTTHSIVGSIVGVGAVAMGPETIHWGKVSQIVLSWVTSPLMGGALSFAIFQILRRTILDRDDPMAQARRIGPLFVFWVFFTLSLVTLFKGLQNLSLDFSLGQAFALSLGIGVLGAGVGALVLRRVPDQPPPEEEAARRSGWFRFAGVERIFAVLQILTACAVAFAHGSNDVANSIGPLAAVVQTATTGLVGGKSPLEGWMLALGGFGIVVGLATYGFRVMETVGRRITELTPSRGFAAELAAATTIVIASRAGIPVSTTHILVGSVLGVGLARGIGALDLRVVGRIALSWLATLPTGAALAVFFYYFFKGLAP